MAKRNFVVVLLASMVAVSASARADQAFVGGDGCAVLAKLVYAEVTAAAWDSPPLYLPADADDVRGDVTVCNRTAKTVSEAFILAMTSVGSDISWTYPSGDPGDHCWGGFLDQCYPQRGPWGSETNTWAAVSGTVRYAMPLGAASDQSVFSGKAMRIALKSALRKQLPWNQALPGDARVD